MSNGVDGTSAAQPIGLVVASNRHFFCSFFLLKPPAKKKTCTTYVKVAAPLLMAAGVHVNLAVEGNWVLAGREQFVLRHTHGIGYRNL